MVVRLNRCPPSGREASASESATEQRTMHIFSYGCNGRAKLMERLGNPDLSMRPGFLPNHSLTVAGFSKTWGGAVMSIVPSPKKVVLGSIAAVSNAELLALDRFEGVNPLDVFGVDEFATPGAYSRKWMVTYDDKGDRFWCIVYVKNRTRYFTNSPPSSAYLLAHHLHLHGFWPAFTTTVSPSSGMPWLPQVRGSDQRARLGANQGQLLDMQGLKLIKTRRKRRSNNFSHNTIVFLVS